MYRSGRAKTGSQAGPLDSVASTCPMCPIHSGGYIFARKRIYFRNYYEITEIIDPPLKGICNNNNNNNDTNGVYRNIIPVGKILPMYKTHILNQLVDYSRTTFTSANHRLEGEVLFRASQKLKKLKQIFYPLFLIPHSKPDYTSASLCVCLHSTHPSITPLVYIHSSSVSLIIFSGTSSNPIISAVHI